MRTFICASSWAIRFAPCSPYRARAAFSAAFIRAVSESIRCNVWRSSASPEPGLREYEALVEVVARIGAPREVLPGDEEVSGARTISAREWEKKMKRMHECGRVDSHHIAAHIRYPYWSCEPVHMPMVIWLWWWPPPPVLSSLSAAIRSVGTWSPDILRVYTK